MDNLVLNRFKIDLDEDTKQKCIKDIEEYFVDDDWCKDAPHYQTYPVLFGREEEHWEKLRLLFFNAFLTDTGKTPSYMRAWAYVSFVGKPTNVSEGWHKHDDDSTNKISSVLYLQYEDVKNGTMFICGDVIVMPLIEENTVYLFNSSLIHSPSTWNHERMKKNRIVLSVDCYF